MAGVKDLVYNLILNPLGFVKGSEEAAASVATVGTKGAESLSKLDGVVDNVAGKIASRFGSLKEKLNLKPVLHPVVDTEAIKEGEHRVLELKEELAKKAQLHIRLTDPEEIARSMKEMRAAQKEIKAVEKGVKQLQSQAEEAGGPLGKIGETIKEKFGGLAGLGAGAGIGFFVDKMFEVGKESQQAAEKLQASFAGNDEAFQKANEGAERLADTYKKDSNEIKAATEAYVNMGGPIDNIGQKQELILAIAHRTHKSLQTAAQALAQTLQGGLSPLTRYVPQMKGVTDASERLSIIQKTLGTDIKAMKGEADDSALGFDHFSVQLKEFEKAGGQILTRFLAPFMDMASNALGWVRSGIEAFKQLPGPIQTIIKVGGELVLVLGAIGIAITAGVAIKKMDIAQNIYQGVIRTKELAQLALTKLALVQDAVARGSATAATWLMNAAQMALNTTFLGFPVLWLVAGLAALVAGVIYAYNHFAFFKNFVDALWGGLKILWGYIVEGVSYVANLTKEFVSFADKIAHLIPGVRQLVDAVKGAVSWIGSLFSSSKDAADGVKKVGDEANTTADAEKALADALDQANQAFANQKQATEDALKAGKEIFERQAEYIRTGYANGVKLTEAQIEAYKEANEKLLSQARDFQAQQKEWAKEGEEFDGKEKKKKVSDTKDTYQQLLSARIAHEKEMDDINAQTADTTLANLRRLQAETQALRDEDIHLNDADRKKARNLGISDAEMRHEILLKSQDEIKKAVEEQQKKIETLRKAADTRELSAYEEKKAKIAETERKAQEAEKTALDRGIITQEQYEANLLAITAKANADYLTAEKEFYAKQEELQIKALDQSIKLEKKTASERARAQTLQDATIHNAVDREIALANDKLAKQLALLNIEHEQAVKAAQIKGEDTTEIDEDYEDKKNELLKAAADERLKIEEDNLKNQNALYQGAISGIQTMFEGLANSIKSTLGNLFGWQKSQWEQMSATEQQLAVLDKNKKIAALSEEVRTNKISYQDYVLQKQKLEEDFAKKQKKNSLDLGQLAQNVEKSITDSILANLAKRAEAWVTDQITKLALSIFYGTANATAQTALAATTAAAWAPAAAMASVASFGGADVAGSTGLAATVAEAQILAAPKDKGTFVDDVASGGRIIRIGEKRPEFAATEEDFAHYSERRLTPMLENVFQRNLLQNPSALRTFQRLQQGPPELHPGISQRATASISTDSKLIDTLSRLHDVATDLRDNGIDARMGDKEFEKGIHRNPKAIENSTRRRNQRIAARSRTTGGGFST